MNYRVLFAITLVVGITPTGSSASALDAKLEVIKRVYSLSPKSCRTDKTIPEAHRVAGDLLFESKSLSGNRDISCSTCHLEDKGVTDGLPIAVGVEGTGEGEPRMADGKGILVPRNALTLIGRGSGEFFAFFWDGKVEREEERIVSQFGKHLPDTFQSPLAVAAILPLISRDEFIGRTSVLRPNDIEREVEQKLYYERYLAVSEAIRTRLLEPQTADDAELAQAVASAGVELESLELAHIGNLLADFITAEFECEKSDWDRYLAGDYAALSNEQKRGAVLFYGKGRCAACHGGPLLSDFGYHSIGTPQGAFGPDSRHRDLGRAAVTHTARDLYQFRTSPLTNVANTPPYGHNGAFQTLREAVVHHFNPLDIYLSRKDYYQSDYFVIGKLLESRSETLGTIDLDDQEEVEAIIEFLRAF